MKRSHCILVLVLWTALCMACVSCSKDETKQDRITLKVMTHDSFSISEAIIADFEKNHGVKVVFLKAGDAGAALNQAILSRNNPLADIFYGVDNTFLSRALDAGIFDAYTSPLLEDIPDKLQLDARHRLLPVDFGDVCLNYDKAWFAAKGLDPPVSLEDLARPAYSGLTVVQNPATSSPGLAFLLATIGHFGEDGYLEFWKQLRANRVLVTDGWQDAYWGQFSASSKGLRPIVVSYATSPPAEVHFAEKELDDAPTAALVAPGTAFRQVEFAGILKGTKHPELARKLIDYFLDRPFQEDIPLQMFVFPANRDARLPDVFVKFARTAQDPVMLSPDDIAANRERWIEAWTEAVLR
ncbi:MAG: thiamine ABC transporter substrate-binding protein [Desulfomonilia bacterium]|nr:thiamine ABC transporter substrate-binding protein [Desulfomonilia bacterium]